MWVIYNYDQKQYSYSIRLYWRIYLNLFSIEDKILENEVRINEVTELRSGKIDKPTKEEPPIVDEINNLKRENRKNRDEIKKL